MKRKEKEKELLQKTKEQKIQNFNNQAKKIMPKIRKLQEKQEKQDGIINPKIFQNIRQKKLQKLNEKILKPKMELQNVLEKEAQLDIEIEQLNNKSQEFQNTIKKAGLITPEFSQKIEQE